MGAVSAIEWTDATWNPIRGCSRVSPGCERCYAERIASRFAGDGAPYAGLIHRTTRGWNGKIRVVDAAASIPLRWRRPRRIFVNSMSDLFHENAPVEAIARTFATMLVANWHTYQVLTKRSARMLLLLTDPTFRERVQLDVDALRRAGAPSGAMARVTTLAAPHIWLGVSVEGPGATPRVLDLVRCPATVRFLSCEPLLGLPILPSLSTGLVHWVIAGGESGPGARPAHPGWYRALRDQCGDHGVAFFFKQWGEWGECPPEDWHGLGPTGSPQQLVIAPDGRVAGGFLGERLANLRHEEGWRPVQRVGRRAAGRTLDGRTHDEFPNATPGPEHRPTDPNEWSTPA